MMLDILFISDYVCPYCLVAKTALKKALEETGIEAQVAYQPFELTEEPKERVDTYNDPVRKEHYKILVEPCKAMGIDMKLPPNIVPRPYTRLAFEGWFFAQEKGRGDEYNDEVYNAYFIDERDIGEVSVLTDIAEKVGLNGEELRNALEAGVYTQREKEAVFFAKNTLSARGVPTIYINGEKIKLTSYTVEEMEAILRQENAASSDDDSFSGCGEDGCSF